MLRRYRMGYAGEEFAGLFIWLAPLSLLLQSITVVAGLQGLAAKLMWLGMLCMLIFSMLLGLGLVILGPGPNRFAGTMLGVVSLGCWLLVQPMQGWAAALGRWIFS